MYLLFYIVEDRLEEQAAALEALKKATDAKEDEELRFAPVENRAIYGFRGDGVNFSVNFSPDLKVWKERGEFMKALGTSIKIGVITDLMFPKEAGAKQEPNGLQVVTDCIDSQLPVVVCSDTDHHEVGYLRSVFPVLARAHISGEIPVILDKKDWDGAVAHLMRLLFPPSAESV